MKRDIRDQMPKTAATDPNKFPDYEYQPYPRMLSHKDAKGKLHPHRDEVGNPVIVHSEEEEKEFLASLTQEEEKAEPAERRKPGPKPSSKDAD